MEGIWTLLRASPATHLAGRTAKLEEGLSLSLSLDKVVKTTPWGRALGCPASGCWLQLLPHGRSSRQLFKSTEPQPVFPSFCFISSEGRA